MELLRWLDVEPRYDAWRDPACLFDSEAVDSLVGLPLGAFFALAVAAFIIRLISNARWGDVLLAAVLVPGVTAMKLGLSPLVLMREEGSLHMVVVLGVIGLLSVGWAFSSTPSEQMRRATMAASTVGLAMVATVLADAMRWREFAEPSRTTEVPASPWFVLLGLTALGLAVTTVARVEANPVATVTVPGLALLLLGPGIAIARDTAHLAELHQSEEPCPSGSKFVHATNCRARFGTGPRFDLQNWYPPAGTDFETDVLERLASEKETFSDFSSQLAKEGRRGVPIVATYVVADETTTLSQAGALLRAAATVGLRNVVFVSFDVGPSGLRTRPYVHQHACGVEVLISPDGMPLRSFANWAEFIRAADDSPTTLRVDPR